ncbi:uncharacterized protein LOC133779285 [Humulus lupulus]|uniref:uncharacterized protein LOC133779285 n=1 Tax=Humulus lupulus TaxID=3486 RepID=UPI002B406D79|nr:uncharacterized protein LOC133779285 [Humulus lupulus]
MSIFVLPQSIIKEIEKLCRGFLWGVNGNRSKIHVASWSKVCLPKAYGGLGFRNGSIWNRAILAKYIWAISEKHDVLWADYHRAVWCRLSIPKHRFLLWQAVNSQLLTCDNMLRFCLALDSIMCPVCGSSAESHSHLFFNCYLSKQILEIIFDWMGFQAWPSEFTGWMVWLSSRKP